MTPKELSEAIGRKYDVRANVSLPRVINRAIRTLPGGPEVLDGIEKANAARNHAERHRANERVVVLDAAIDRLETIRAAMESHVIESVSGED